MKYIQTLEGRRPYNLNPQVGDAVYNVFAKDNIKYLVARIGPYVDKESESWFAVDMSNGTLSAVAVGQFWKLVKEEDEKSTNNGD